MARPVKHVISIGTEYNWLVTTGLPISDGHSRHVPVRCRCGVEKMVEVCGLVCGDIRSCGCYSHKFDRPHGWSNTRLYKTWENMIQRCTNTRASGYKNYGGRGIKVCRAWRLFSVFAEWALANGYKDELTIDRKKTNLNYTPSNCRFTIRRSQAQSHRKRTNSETEYIGVVRDKRNGRRLCYSQSRNGKSRYLGSFDDPFSAAWVRDTYVRRHYDTFVTLNNLTERRKISKAVQVERRGTFDWKKVFNKWRP